MFNVIKYVENESHNVYLIINEVEEVKEVFTMLLLLCKVQRSFFIFILNFRIDASLQQHFADLHRTTDCGIVKSVPSLVISLFRISTALQETKNFTTFQID